LSDVQLLRKRGYTVRARASHIADGIERVRRRLDRRTLCIDPRCTQLIQAMSVYHFNPDRPQDDAPVKDGPDHLCDALRYMVINLEAGAAPVVRRFY
jgi:hypothetical protein